MTKKYQIDLRAVAYQEEGVWLAHCLELDIVTDGQDPHEAMSNLVDLIRLQIGDACEHNAWSSLFRPAPSEIWDIYFRAEKSDLSQTEIPECPKKSRSRFCVNHFEQRQLLPT